MPRALSPSAIAAANAENNPDPFLILLTIDVGGQFVYLVNNTENIVSRGVTFVGCPFTFVLPDSLEQVIAESSIEIDNVDPRIWQGIRLLNEAPHVTIEVILASEPNTILLSGIGMRLREATATSQKITGKIIPDNVWHSGFPAHEFDPAQNPGLFGT